MLSPLICTPCYTERPTAIYVTSLVRLFPVPDLFMPSQCSLAAARTRCVNHFLAGEWSHLFFIDDDMGFDGGTFKRMLTSGKAVVAAAAPFRSDAIQYQGGFTVDRDDIGDVDPNGFASITLIGAGFMCISREALVEMATKFKTDQFFTLSSDSIGSTIEEDHTFCLRWREIGGTVFIDTQAELAHQGVKVYRRDFGAYLRGKPRTFPA